MMGSYTKLYKDKLDIKNYQADFDDRSTYKDLSYDKVK